MTHNIENILKLADFIEKLPDYDSNVEKKPKTFRGHAFHMGDWVVNMWYRVTGGTAPCGTAGCVAGSATFCFRKEYNKFARNYTSGFSDTKDFGKEILGLNFHESEQLFVPSFLNMNVVKAKDAVETLRRLARTGKVHWNKRIRNRKMS